MTSTSTATAVTTGAVAGATATAVASASARADRKCVAYMASPDLTTPAGRQQYAACVERMEPAERDLPPREVVGFFLLVAFVGAAIAVYRDHKSGGWVGPVLSALFGAVMALMATLVAAVVAALTAYALGLTS